MTLTAANFFAAGCISCGVAGAASPRRRRQDKAPPGAIHFNVPDDPTKERGPRRRGRRRLRARARNLKRKCAWRFPDREREHVVEHDARSTRCSATLTASGLHFERHHGGIPTIDPAKH